MIDKNVIVGFVLVGLIATSYVLFRAVRTGKVIELFPIYRAKHPIAFWVYCAFAGWIVIACAQYLYEAFV